MILKKIGEEYKLYSHDSCIATTQDSPHKRLSKQNCDEIFGAIDVEKLSEEEYPKTSSWRAEEEYEPIGRGYLKGFNKAMELNKDKLFTVEDMNYIFQLGFSLNGKSISKSEYDAHIQSLQQPTEIEVEIDMNIAMDGHTVLGYELDENGCLILKKK